MSPVAPPAAPRVQPETLAALLRGARSEFVSAISGGSMGSTIPHGSEIRIRCGRGERQVGQVVVFLRDEELVAHRVVAVGQTPAARGYVITRGDDPSICDAPVRLHDVLGEVTAVRMGSVWRPVPPPGRQPGWRDPVARALDRSAGLALRVHPRLAAALIWSARRVRRVCARLSGRGPAQGPPPLPPSSH